MIRIGDFSKLSRVPVKTLRYYDEMGRSNVSQHIKRLVIQVRAHIKPTRRAPIQRMKSTNPLSEL
jgi:hypothetical protein